MSATEESGVPLSINANYYSKLKVFLHSLQFQPASLFPGVPTFFKLVHQPGGCLCLFIILYVNNWIACPAKTAGRLLLHLIYLLSEILQRFLLFLTHALQTFSLHFHKLFAYQILGIVEFFHQISFFLLADIFLLFPTQ